MDAPETTPAPRPGAGRRARLALVLALFAGVLACDQATKRWAVAALPEGARVSFLADCVRLERVWNPGAFLSLGARLPPAARALVFTWVVAGLVVAALAVALLGRTPVRTACATALLAAGGAGNLWDRLATGGWVIDFMNVGIGPLRTGIFNVADLAIGAGVAVFLLPARRRAAGAGSDLRPSAPGGGAP